MGHFLDQVSAAHPHEFIVMIDDVANSRVAKALLVPENIRHHRLPAYSPQLNPQEDLWDELRENEFPNRVYADMTGVLRQLEQRLPQLRCGYRASPHHRGLALDSQSIVGAEVELLPYGTSRTRISQRNKTNNPIGLNSAETSEFWKKAIASKAQRSVAH